MKLKGGESEADGGFIVAVDRGEQYDENEKIKATEIRVRTRGGQSEGENVDDKNKERTKRKELLRRHPSCVPFIKLHIRHFLQHIAHRWNYVFIFVPHLLFYRLSSTLSLTWTFFFLCFHECQSGAD